MTLTISAIDRMYVASTLKGNVIVAMNVHTGDLSFLHLELSLTITTPGMKYRRVAKTLDKVFKIDTMDEVTLLHGKY